MEANKKTLYYETSDSLLAFCLNISLAKAIKGLCPLYAWETRQYQIYTLMKLQAGEKILNVRNGYSVMTLVLINVINNNNRFLFKHIGNCMFKEQQNGRGTCIR